MKQTLLVVSTNREIDFEAQNSINAALAAGAGMVLQRGTSDVALARNIALSITCDTFRQWPERDVALMLDDDIIFSLEQARAVVDRARLTQGCVSGLYATSGGTMAATRRMAPDGRWLVGLGFVAIYRDVLLKLERESEGFWWKEKLHHAFTWTAVDGKERWWSEDYRLCQRLGGVEVLPIGVGHMKKIPIYPDDETLARVARGDALPEGDGAQVVLTERRVQ